MATGCIGALRALRIAGLPALCAAASGCSLFSGVDSSMARWAGGCPPVTSPLDASVDLELAPKAVIEAGFAPVDGKPPGRPRSRLIYDAAGRLTSVEVDTNLDGRVDRWEYLDGATSPRRLELDSDDDTRTDRWVEIGPDGRATSVRVDSDKDGTPDATRVPDPELDVSISTPPPVSAGGSCAADEDCQRYIADLRADVLSQWRPTEPDDRIRVQFFMSESGCSYDARVLEAGSRESATSALVALSRSRPLRELPKELSDLRNEKIVITFSLASTEP
jgi:hypothetical protein